MTKQVFEGIKVVDLAWSGVGPQVGRELAYHGATVIRVESHSRPCPLRSMAPFKDGIPGLDRAGVFAEFNAQKYGMTVDLTHPNSREVARRLVTWADIISDSMTPGTLAKWELDYESCRRLNPRVIYFSTTMQGQDGPYRDFQGFGHHANALFGVSHTTGWPDGEPNLCGTAYSDFVAPWYLLVAVIGALLKRLKTGEGTYIEQSQLEAGLSFMAPHLLDYGVNGRILERMGNRDREMAPHGIYPCMGADRWVAIAVADDAQWRGVCKVIGKPDWSADLKYATMHGRKANEEEVDRLIGEWTKKYTPEQVMKLMQEAGVPAGVVQNGEDLLNDPQLRYRGHFPVLQHSAIGFHAYHAPAYKLSRTPCQVSRPAACLGEHNWRVYKDILGFSDEEIANMIAEGVITTES
jgi:benzylsuccinate CoA-transferase BbsF subunit